MQRIGSIELPRGLLVQHISPNPPQHDCFRPGPELREFSVYYLTPHGVRSLLWFRLPQYACAAETSTPTASAPFASVCLCATR